MPGGGVELHISPPPRWPIEHRNVRQLHGLVSVLLNVPHQRWPEWSLVPWSAGCGWGLYVRREECLSRLAGKTFEASLYDRPVEVRCSPVVRVKAPAALRRGHRRVRVDAITPVVITSDGHTVHRTAPCGSSLISALTCELPGRLGLDIFDRSTARLEMVSNETHPENVYLGGKFGVIRGWVGSCLVEANAVARWLLHAAGRGPGLGSRVAFGFGRIRVTDI